MTEINVDFDLATEQERWETIVRSAQDNLAKFAELLIQEARDYKYSPQTRDKFVLAVGAVALIHDDVVHNPPYLMTATAALRQFGPLSLIDAEDPDMPHWNHDDWEKNLRRIAAQIHFTDENVAGGIEHSTTGYVIAVDALRSGTAIFSEGEQ